ncbi:MAG TPA: hypothetical protein VHA13_03105 [Gammaproteobacteria bacterium]|nr:hypothetical protein [Gammaproteobacteria bacterium]
MRSQQELKYILKTQQELQDDMDAILKGNWSKREELLNYFNPGPLLDTSFDEKKKRDKAKKEQGVFCYNYIENKSETNSFALATLGSMSSRGIGTYPSHNSAIYYYRKSAELNNAWGLASLAICYFNGKYVKQDLNYARALCIKADSQNYPPAQYLLYLIDLKTKRRGCNVWLSKALSSNYPPALKALCIRDWSYANPFEIYIPKSKMLMVRVTKLESGANSHKITIKYKGNVQIKDYKLFEGEINLNLNGFKTDLVKKEALKMARLSLAKVFGWVLCFPFLPVILPLIYLSSITNSSNVNKPRSFIKRAADIEKCIERLAMEALSKQAQEILAGYIQIADQELARRIELAQSPPEYKSDEPLALPGVPSTESEPTANPEPRLKLLKSLRLENEPTSSEAHGSLPALYCPMQPTVSQTFFRPKTGGSYEDTIRALPRTVRFNLD